MSSYAAALIGNGEKNCYCDETIVIVYISTNLDRKDSNEVGEAWNHGVQVPQVLCGQVQYSTPPVQCQSEKNAQFLVLDRGGIVKSTIWLLSKLKYLEYLNETLI